MQDSRLRVGRGRIELGPYAGTISCPFALDVTPGNYPLSHPTTIHSQLSTLPPFKCLFFYLTIKHYLRLCFLDLYSGLVAPLAHLGGVHLLSGCRYLPRADTLGVGE